MESFSSLFKKEHMGELVLVILLIVYLILGFKTPEPIASMIDSLVGKVVIFIIVIYLFMHANPILAVLSLFVAFDLIRRSSIATGIDALQKFAPSEQKKSSQFTAFNQFPYTLEQEVVKKMTSQKFNTEYVKAPFRPTLDDTHDASPLTT
jgi:hypothetical protein